MIKKRYLTPDEYVDLLKDDRFLRCYSSGNPNFVGFYVTEFGEEVTTENGFSRCFKGDEVYLKDDNLESSS